MLDHRTSILAAACCALLGLGPAMAQQSPAPDFIPDYVFQGSNLTAWQPIGQADWQAVDGGITGTADSGDGWLVFDRSYQDVAVFSRFRCAGACNAGILLRAEKTATGLKGILVSLYDGTVAPYRVTLDESGQLLTKELARDPEEVFRRSRWANPVQIEAGAWNSIEIFIDGNDIYNHLNGERHAIQGGIAQAVSSEQPSSEELAAEIVQDAFGPIALYVGSGSVHYDAIAVKDLNLLTIEPERTSSRFRAQRLSAFSYAWGADVGDIDRDGVLDVIAGPYYYLGPDFKTRREYYPARTFNPGQDYALNMLTLAEDWTGDGWVDLLVTEMRPLVLHINPKGENRRWDRVEALPDVCSEIALPGDFDNDGLPEVAFMGSDGRLAYGEPDPSNPTAPWLVQSISEPIGSRCSAHGLGVGDVNGDGRTDVLQTHGWWEQPATNPARGAWPYHEAVFGRPPNAYGGGIISVYDFNGDGLNDVVASLEAHGWGLAWYEQQRNTAGEISFVQHTIMDNFSTKNAGDVTFSQLHAGTVLADIDGDGIMDFVTGKRHWAHLDTRQDPDADGEAVVYWYRTVRKADAPGGVAFAPELIHNKSGVGSELKVADINRDGAVDIITAGTRGAFIFWGVPVE